MTLSVLVACFCAHQPADCKEDKNRSSEPISLEHGVFHLRQMLLDRKQMSSYADVHGQTISVTEKDDIFVWMAKRFEGLNTGIRVAWDATMPGQGCEAEHSIAIMGDPATIRIKDLTYKDGLPNTRFERLWFAAVFEMCNLENQHDFANLINLAAKGLIERPKFVNEAARLEHRALLKSRVFYHKVWLKWAGKKLFESDFAIWDRSWKANFDDWLAAYRQTSTGYPESAFEPLFDWCKAHYKRYLEQPSRSKSLNDKKANP